METQEETVFRCDRCDQDYPITERIEFEGEQYCNDCFNAVTLICSCCGERIRRDENYGNDSTPLCENCYDRNYTTCNHCGRLLRYDDACYDGDGQSSRHENDHALLRQADDGRHRQAVDGRLHAPQPEEP